jgi:hypothetical protein
MFLSNITVNPGDSVGCNIRSARWTLTLLSNGALYTTSNYNFPDATFLNQTPSNVLVATNTIFTWSNISNVDMYGMNLYASNFYATTTPRIFLRRPGVPFGVSNRLILTDLNQPDGLKSNIVDFYLEVQNTNPTGRIFVRNEAGGISFCNICGVSVITSSNFDFWIQASNIGTHFYFNTPVGARLSNIGRDSSNFIFDSNTTFYSEANTSDTYSTVPIRNPTFFYWSNVTVQNSFGADFSLTGNVSNMISQSAISGSFRPYFDPESVAILNCNVRVESGGASYPSSGFTNFPAVGSFGATFDNRSNFSGTKYQFELQLVNGIFTTRANGIAGPNYESNLQVISGLNPDYSKNLNTSGKNWITFLFSNQTPSNVLNKIDEYTFTINNLTINALNSIQNTVQVRINSNTATTTNNTTGWLNALSNNTSIPITSKASNDTGCFISYSESNLTIKIPDGCGYSNSSNNIYLRIGLNPAHTTPLGVTTVTTSQKEISLPDTFNALLFVNCNSGLSRQRFNINLAPNLPLNIFTTISPRFTLSNDTYSATPTLIATRSDYLFTTFTPSINSNIHNTYAVGSYTICNAILPAIPSAIYTSNTIESKDYFPAPPLTTSITFTSEGGSSNFVVNFTFNNTYLTRNTVSWVASNDTRTFVWASNNSFASPGVATYTLSNPLTSNQYLNRAFYMSANVIVDIPFDGTQRESSRCNAASNGILSVPSRYTVLTFSNAGGSRSSASNRITYTSQHFTPTPTSVVYSFTTFSNAGFPRSIVGFTPYTSPEYVDSITGNPPYVTLPRDLEVFDTNYYVLAALSNSVGLNTSNASNASRTLLPIDSRNTWATQSYTLCNAFTFSNRGISANGSLQTFYNLNSNPYITLRGVTSNIAVNSLANPGGSGIGCNITVIDSNGTNSYTFNTCNYWGSNFNVGGLSNRSYDHYGIDCNAFGFWLAFDASLSNTYSATSNIQNNSITFWGRQITCNIYVADDPGQLTLSLAPLEGSNEGPYMRSSGSVDTAYGLAPPYSYSNAGDAVITYTNLFGEVYAGPTWWYSTYSSTTPLSNPYGIDRNGSQTMSGSEIIISNGVTGPIQLSVSLCNLNGNASSNISFSLYKNTIAIYSNPDSSTYSADDGVAWLQDAWYASLTSEQSNAIRATYCNSDFSVGAGNLYLSNMFALNSRYFSFDLTSNITTNISACEITFPQGTFNCLEENTNGGIPSGDTGGAALIPGFQLNCNYCVYAPPGFDIASNISLRVRLVDGSLSNILPNRRILYEPSGYSVETFSNASNVLTSASNRITYNPTFPSDTPPPTSIVYSFTTFSNAGFPRSIRAFTPYTSPDYVDSITYTIPPLTILTTSNQNLSVYDTPYWATISLSNLVGLGSNTSNSSRTLLPPDNRNIWEPTYSLYNTNIFTNQGTDSTGALYDVYKLEDAPYITLEGIITNIAVNSVENPGSGVEGCNISITYLDTTETYNFVTTDYDGNSFTSNTLTITTRDSYGTSGAASGFFLEMDASLSNNYTASSNIQNNSITFAGQTVSCNIYVDSDPKLLTLLLSNSEPSNPWPYNAASLTDMSYGSNAPYSYSNPGDFYITYTNLYNNIHAGPTWWYSTYGSTTPLSNPYGVASSGEGTMSGATITLSNGVNTVEFEARLMNLNGPENSNSGEVKIYKNTESYKNSDGSIYSADEKVAWIQDAWYASLDVDQLSDIQTTYNNSGFSVGPGNLYLSNIYASNSTYFSFDIGSNSETNISNCFITVPYSDPSRGFGKFNCFELNTTNGIPLGSNDGPALLPGFPFGCNYTVYLPFNFDSNVPISIEVYLTNGLLSNIIPNTTPAGPIPSFFVRYNQTIEYDSIARLDFPSNAINGTLFLTFTENGNLYQYTEVGGTGDPGIPLYPGIIIELARVNNTVDVNGIYSWGYNYTP